MEYILNLLNTNNVELLASLEYNKLTVKNRNDMTILMNCCINKYTKITKLLVYLLHRLNIEDIVCSNEKNNTALFFALKNRYSQSEEIVKLLLPYYDKTYIRSLYISTTVQNNKIAIYNYLDLDKENAKYLEIISHIDKFSYKKLKLYTKEDLLWRNTETDNTILLYACKKTNKKSYKAIKYILKILNPDTIDDVYFQSVLIKNNIKEIRLFEKYCNIQTYINNYKFDNLIKVMCKKNIIAINFIIKHNFSYLNKCSLALMRTAILTKNLICIDILLKSFEYEMRVVLELFLYNSDGSNTIDLEIFYHIINEMQIIGFGLLNSTYYSNSIYSFIYFKELLLKSEYDSICLIFYTICDKICTSSHMQIFNLLLSYLKYEDIVKCDPMGYTPFMKHYSMNHQTLEKSIFLSILKPEDIICTNKANNSIIDIIHEYYNKNKYSIEKYFELLYGIIPYYPTDFLANRLLELDSSDHEYDIISNYIHCCLK